MGTPGRKTDDKTRSNVVKWRENGESFAEISRREMVSVPTVKKILRSDVDKFRKD